MKLTIYNGSPRGLASNSNKIADFLCEELDDNLTVSRHCINKTEKHNKDIEDVAIQDATDAHFIVFPLYADAMPFAVKLFFEKMEEHKAIFENKPIYYFIHSGFPEAKQSRLLERYLKYFTKIIGAQYMGTAIMGNSEMIRYMDEKSKRRAKIQYNMKAFAKDIETGKPFNKESIEYFRGMETMPKFVMFLLKKFPSVFNKGFDMMFKRHDSFDKRYHQTYI